MLFWSIKSFFRIFFFSGLIQKILADSNARHSKLGPKEDEGLINLIKAIEG